MDAWTTETRETRQRRVMYIIFAVGMLISLAICGWLFVAVAKQPIHLVRLGPLQTFKVAQPIDVPVKQLETSKLIPSRSNLSEDIIFVVQQTDGSFRAFLGLDPVSGCFMLWHKESREYGGSCTQTTYDINGINKNDVATGVRRPTNMVEFPTRIENNVLFLEDRILRRDIR
ncbi:MAG: hypothetical protein NVS4B8_04160 [Herpetosiphon sp.]